MRPQVAVLCCTLMLLSAAAVQAKINLQVLKSGEGEEEHKLDQEQFLGKDRAKEFSSMDKEESVKKLKQIIANDVDTDKDGFVTQDELIQYLQKIQANQTESEVESSWRDLKLEKEFLDWATYARTLRIGLFDGTAPKATAEIAATAVDMAGKDATSIDIPLPDSLSKMDRSQLQRFFRELLHHRKRWQVADTNSDGKITMEEYGTLLLPEESPKMRQLMAAEQLEEADSNKDGFVTLDEYINSLWTPKSPGQKEPKWLAEERKEFAKKDKNGDGKLDLAEIEQSVLESSLEQGSNAKQEAEHLMKDADTNKDGKLSMEEVENSHDLFAGSQATNYGDDLESGEGHDEL